MQCQCVVSSACEILDCQKVFQLCLIARHFADTCLTIRKGKDCSPGDSLIGLISLLIRRGDDLTITAIGPQEKQALTRIESFLRGVSEG